MNRICLFLSAALLGALLVAGDAWGHGGTFRGPNGGVPPGLREPSDPEPPPPPPSDPGDPGGPITPTPDGNGPTTPQPDPSHPESGGGNGGPAPIPTPSANGGKRGGAKTALSYSSWRFWWGYNNDDILNLKAHIYSNGGVNSFSPLAFTTGEDKDNVRDALRPTQKEVQDAVIPALLRTIHRVGDHEDIHGGAIVALGKLGNSRHVPIFEEATWNRFRNNQGTRMDFGYQATESAVLALGLLPNLDNSSRDTVRRICLAAIADASLRTRERSWAAICLGLQRDTDAIAPMVEMLGEKYGNANIPAAILAGLGLIGDASVLPVLIEIVENGRFDGQTVSERVRPFAAYAMGKIGSAEALPVLTKILKSRRTGRILKRSAAIATGAIAAKATDENKAEAVHALVRYYRGKGGDTSGKNFALIALSQIGTEKALHFLLEIAESGKYTHRPFAALGLATHVFYRDRDFQMKRAARMDADLRSKIVDNLIRLSRKHRDSDTRSAFMLGRGLVKDKTAIEELTSIVYARNFDPVLRGYCCVALGLIGDARDEVRDALRVALAERKSTELRSNAATGLGLLHDAKTVDFLLRELKKARSFAVQGQLIQAIGTIGDQSAIAPLIAILDDRSQPAQARAMAAVGLGMIGDTRPLPPLSRLSKNYNYRASVPDIDELLYIL